MLFKELVKLGIPDYILNQKINADIIDVVLDYIEANSSISYDITKVYTSNNTALKEEFINTYLENISSSFDKALYDQNIIERLTKVYESLGMTYDPTSIPNLADVFTDEYLDVSKTFKQRKGTSPAIKFAYNAIRSSKVQGVNVSSEIDDAIFDVRMGTAEDRNQPFIFEVDGTLYKEVYENMVKPIVHPVGFGYIYAKILAVLFSEYVNLTISYPDASVIVKCNNGAYQIDYSDRPIKLIYDEQDVNARIKTTVLFQDGTYIIRDYNTTVKYFNSDDTINAQYPDACALYLQYTMSLVTTLTDSYSSDVYCETEDKYILGGITGGSGETKVGGIIVGSFIIGALPDSYTFDLIYDDTYSPIRIVYQHAALIGTFSIGNRCQWVIGNEVDCIENQGEDNYVVPNEVFDDFTIEVI